MGTDPMDARVAALLRTRLLGLARRYDDLAANEASTTPYWQPQPTSVHALRVAAGALRAEADLFLDITRAGSQSVSAVDQWPHAS